MGLAAAVGAAAEVAAEVDSGGSAGFPSAAGLGELNPEGEAIWDGDFVCWSI